MKKAIWFSVAMGVVAAVASLVMWGQMPAKMPIHWGLNGQPDSFMAKEYALWLFPAIIALMPVLILGLLRIDPRRENVDASKTPLAWLFAGLSAFFLAIHGLTLHAATQPKMALSGEIVLVLVGLLFVGLGVLMPKMKSNWFVGIRTPWTLSSDTVWEKTHLIGGRLMVVAGLCALPAALLLPTSIGVATCVALFVTSGLLPVLLSYVYFRREQQS